MNIIHDFGIVPNLLSFLLLIFAIYQSVQAYNQKISAETAVSEAQVALQSARRSDSLSSVTLVHTKAVEDSILKYEIRLKEVTHLVIENSYILASESFLSMGGDAGPRRRIEENMALLGKYVESDSLKNKEMWNSIEKIFEFRKGGK